MPSDISIGAIGAALIGAIISLVSLIVAKEAKVSEFRQAWIDALRSSLATFLTNVNAIVDASQLEFSDEKEKFRELQKFYSQLNESYYSIALRLNSDENLSRNLKGVMVAMANIVQYDVIDLKKFDEHRVQFIKSSSNLLKYEWARVKNGEPIYRWTRYISAGAVIALLIFVASIFIFYKMVKPAQESSGIVTVRQDKAKREPVVTSPIRTDPLHREMESSARASNGATK